MQQQQQQQQTQEEWPYVPLPTGSNQSILAMQKIHDQDIEFSTSRGAKEFCKNKVQAVHKLYKQCMNTDLLTYSQKDAVAEAVKPFNRIFVKERD